MRKIDIENWNRKHQYLFFKDYDDPYFGLCTTLDVTSFRRYVEDRGLSFFLCSLYVLQETANGMFEFRLRIKDNDVLEFLDVDIGSTILREDETFGFCYFEKRESLEEFHSQGKEVMSSMKAGMDSEEAGRLDLFYSSFLPWISFTSVKHATNVFGEKSGIPKFVFGKYYREGDRWLMPFSVEVHHALMDGIHVGKFLSRMQKNLDKIELTEI